MGYGVPAAIAAKLVAPERDGRLPRRRRRLPDERPELATAVQEALPIVVIVVNNGMYGTIRMHQERALSRAASSAPTSRNPDFVAFARAFGATASGSSAPRSSRTRSTRALAAGVPALIELRCDPEAITPHTTLTAVREGTAARERTETGARDCRPQSHWPRSPSRGAARTTPTRPARRCRRRRRR